MVFLNLLWTTQLIELFLLLYLALLSFIDIRKQVLPSVLTTSGVFILALVNFNNLAFGVLAFIFGWLLMEGFSEDGEFFSGVADLKVMVMMGLTVNSLGMFLLLCVITVVVGTLYKALAVYLFKQKKGKGIAFIPALLITYILLLILKFIIGGQLVW